MSARPFFLLYQYPILRNDPVIWRNEYVDQEIKYPIFGACIRLNLPVKCIVIDDNEIDLELACHFAGKVPDLQLAGKFSDPVEAFSALSQTHDNDLLLCDIDMPNLNGLDLIKTLKNPPQVIFLTYHPDLAIEGFEVEATDYLLKPYSFDRFLRAIRKAKEKQVRLNESSIEKVDYFFVRAGQQFVKIFYRDVIYIEALKDYVKIVTPQRIHLTAVNLKKVEDYLVDPRFYRASRSLVINLDKIESLNNFEVKLHGGYSVLISDATAKKIQERIVNERLIKR